MEILLCLVMGYAAGMINPSYIIGKIRGFDIRDKGSRNAGGSNALITMGKAVGVLCMIFDIAKAAGVSILAHVLFPDSLFAFPAAAVGVVAGHIFPPYMKFRGGKGFACLGGVILAYNPIVFGIMLAGAVPVVLVSDYICFVPLYASVVFPVVYGVMSRNPAGAAVLLLITALIFFRHVENFRRIREGTELHFSYLWKKDSEMERIGATEKNGDPERED
ncbi:MAG: glycerol-3-phosphate acyltransferase [Clostridia bacterium]|nr:glycerol-3-phosphate acyltransferase [Clostridia bacterium]